MKRIVMAIVLATVLGRADGASAEEWWEKMTVKGDLRYRHEMIDQEDKDARHRHRIRARFGIFAKASDYTKIGIQLATGSTDPVSTNQTLDGAFSTKNVGVDLAYFTTSFPKIDGLSLTAGKLKNPFYKAGKSELVWDSDYNPEGGVAVYKKDFDNTSLMLLGAGLWIDERSSGDDSWMAGGQVVLSHKLGDKKTSFAVGGSMFNYVNTKGFAPFYDDDGFGNSLDMVVDGDDTTHVFGNEYELFELFGEASHKINQTPITVMGDYVSNTAADSLNTGWLVGVRVGKAKKPGSWEFRYNYREIETDAVVGTFADSDFRGGGTDAKGHEMGGAVQLAANSAFKATYFINTIGLDADESDFNRLQVDLQLKF
ncbi:MAG: hypothetical protein GY867_07460 [bacterium]|nr:hypothetical protein [bacterium]